MYLLKLTEVNAWMSNQILLAMPRVEIRGPKIKRQVNKKIKVYKIPALYQLDCRIPN